MGISDVRDDAAWSAVDLEVTNRGGDFRGTIEVIGKVGDTSQGFRGALPYRLETEVARDTTRRFSFPVRPEGWTQVEVRLEQRSGGVRYVFDLPLPPSGDFRALVIDSDRPNLNQFESWIKSFVDDPVAVHLDPEHLPELSRAYDPFHWVILHRTSLAAASAQAREALADWVERGGTLLAFPGPEWAAGLPERVQTLLGLKGFQIAEPGPNDKGLVCTLLPVDEAVRGANNLSVQSRPGAGQALTFAREPAGGLPGAGREGEGVSASLRAAAARAVSFAGFPHRALRRIENSSPAALFELSGFRVPESGAVTVGLGVYLLVGFLVPAVIWRRSGKRERRFIVVVAASALAAAAIYFSGLLNAIKAPHQAEITVLRAHAGGKTADAMSLVALMAPRWQAVPLALPSPTALVQPLRGEVATRHEAGWSMRYSLSLERGTGAIVDPSGRVGVTEARLHPNAPGYFRVDHRVSLDAFPLKVSRGPVRQQLVLKNTGERPIELQLVRDTTLWTVNPLLPGEERAISTRQETTSFYIGRPDNDDSVFAVNFVHKLVLPSLVFALDPVATAGPRSFRIAGGTSTTDTQPARQGSPTFVIARVESGVLPLFPGMKSSGGFSVLIAEIPNPPAE